jgi:PhnB protein
MAKQVKPIPEGQHTLTPHLVVRGAGKAIDFYKKAFGAKEKSRMVGPDGKSILHAEIQIGDSWIYLVDEMPEMGARSPQALGGTTVSIHVYVEDADAVFNQAVVAGAKAEMPLADMFWGDRFGKLTDPFGHEWTVATHKEDVTPEEMKKRAAAAFAQMPQKKG